MLVIFQMASFDLLPALYNVVHCIKNMFHLGICKLEWIDFVYILESLQAKNQNLWFCKINSSFPRNNDMTIYFRFIMFVKEILGSTKSWYEGLCLFDWFLLSWKVHQIFISC
jgi:hypothetical protein